MIPQVLIDLFNQKDREYGIVARGLLCTNLNDDLLPDEWTANHILHYGGEDKGLEYWSVWGFCQEGQSPIFIRFNGSYLSYEGATFESYEEVVPVEKTVIVYERK